MIILKKLTWSNFFSYGDNNTIDFNKDTLTQILGENGCIAEGTTVLGESGQIEFIEDLVYNKIDIKPFGQKDTNITDYIYSGEKEVFEVQLDSGDLLHITDNHKLLTYEGWKPLNELKENDFIINTRHKPVDILKKQDELYWKIITYLATEGGLTNIDNRITFSNDDKEIANDFSSLLKEYNEKVYINCTDANRKGNYYINFTKNSSIKKDFISYITQSNNIVGYSKERWLPNEFIRLEDLLLDKLMAIYLATDGCLATNRTHLSFSTSSKKMAQQLLFVLRYRYGLLTSIRTKKTYRADNYEINITRLDQIQILLNRIRPYIKGYKCSIADDYLNRKTSSSSYTHDLVPKYLLIDSLVKQSKPGERIFDNQEQKKAGQSLRATKHGIQRKNYRILSSNNKVNTLDNFDNITFMRIKKITGKGIQHVYDLTTTSKTFCADNILVHNSGKSSIPLILEEVLYGKNSKGIKKGDIPNRGTESNKLDATLEFEVDEIPYKIVLVRRASIKLSLYMEGTDISSHTSRGTYETIEDILGLDFKTFTQLTYQSSKSSLGFLTATDANRKAFLISMFGLNEYEKYLEIYKKASRELISAKSTLSGECKSLAAFITKYSAMDFNKMKVLEVPDKPIEESKELGVLELELKNMATTNALRTKNNTYKDMLTKIDMSFLSSSSSKPTTPEYEAFDNKDKILAEGKIADATKEMTELEDIGSGKCPKCRQDIDDELVGELINDNEQIIGMYSVVVEEADIASKKIIGDNKILRDTYNADLAKYKEMTKNLNDFETLTSQFDMDLESDLIDSNVLKTDISNMKISIKEINDAIDDAIDNNTSAADKNSKIQVVKKQLSEHRSQLSIATEKLSEIEDLEANVNILKKAFSTTGLVAFKLEFLAKTLEKEINRYLSILSSGRFQLEFILEKEKLNIEIQDDGNGISIIALSSGELARVNAATLLAIRNMMNRISGNTINLLFLDEILGVLDPDGKENLITLLLEEHELNTFIVSHEFSHPLLETIHIQKTKGISNITEG